MLIMSTLAEIKEKYAFDSDVQGAIFGSFVLKRDGKNVTLSGYGHNKKWSHPNAEKAKQKYNEFYDALLRFNHQRITLKELESKLGFKIV